MNQQYKTDKKHRLLLLLILLLILVFVSGMLVGVTINKYSHREQTLDIPISGVVKEKNPSGQTSQETVQETAGVEETQPFTPKPGMSVDGGAALTELTLFKATYKNDGHITVESAGGDKIIAPGTSNSKKVRIVNTGNCALDYDIVFEDIFKCVLEGFTNPLEVRVSDSSGKYIIGGSKTWIPLDQLPAVSESGTIGKGCYEYYTFHWRWPFEKEISADLTDTMLGNTEPATECGIRILTTAVQNEDPNAQGGLSSPVTGDEFNVSLWVYMAAGSLLLLLFLILNYPKRRKEEDAA